MTKTKKPVRHLAGRDLEMDVVKKIYRQLDRLPHVKDSMRVLAYVQSVTHEGSPAYAKQLALPEQDSYKQYEKDVIENQKAGNGGGFGTLE